MSAALYIGIDGGGTGCRARIADAEGRALGEGTGGPANVRLDSALVMSSILTASRAAAAAAGLSERDLQRAHAGLGLAGAALRSANARLLAEPHPFRSVTLETDAYAAWLGATGGGDGAILILGTGSCGLAVVAGKQIFVGGYGAEVSDEASGHWLGREAIRRSLWAHDGRAPATPFTTAVMARFNASTEAVIAFATAARPGEYGRLVPLVLEHARQGDPVALALMADAAADAGRIIARLIAAGAPRVSLVGGLAETMAKWLPADMRAHLTAPKGDALAGALLMARGGVGPGGGVGA
jgi:glucosamine kinase